MIDRDKLVRYLEGMVNVDENRIEKYRNEGKESYASSRFSAQWENKRLLEMVRMGAFDKEEIE